MINSSVTSLETTPYLYDNEDRNSIVVTYVAPNMMRTTVVPE